MTRREQLEGSIRRQPGLGAVNGLRETCARLEHVELARGFDCSLQLERSRPESTRQLEQDASDLLRLLFLERHDLVVHFDGAERFQVEARPARRSPMHNPGDAGAVLGFDHEDVPTVPLGDDLVLEVLGRVLAAQVRLQRAAQPRPLLTKPIADDAQLRAGVIDDVARRGDRIAHAGDFALERRGVRPHLIEEEKRLSHSPDGAAGFIERLQKRGEGEEPRGFERPTLDRERRQDDRKLARGPQGEWLVPTQIVRRLSGSGEQRGHLLRVARRSKLDEAFVTHRRERIGAYRLDNPVEFEGL